jgi:hypothetical protein
LGRRNGEQGLWIREWRTGTEIARVGDWKVVIWASRLRLFLFSAREGKLSAKPARAAAQGRLRREAGGSGYSFCGTALRTIFRSELSCQTGSFELRFRGSSRTAGERLQFQSVSRGASRIFLEQGVGAAGAAYCRLWRQPPGRVSLSEGFEAFQVVLDNSESCRVPYTPIQNLP